MFGWQRWVYPSQSFRSVVWHGMFPHLFPFPSSPCDPLFMRLMFKKQNTYLSLPILCSIVITTAMLFLALLANKRSGTVYEGFKYIPTVERLWVQALWKSPRRPKNSLFLPLGEKWPWTYWDKSLLFCIAVHVAAHDSWGWHKLYKEWERVWSTWKRQL